MELSAIIKIIESALSSSQQGQQIESDKIDFKRCWYDLKAPKDINEFLKDTSSIANTVGLDGFIIIGFDDKLKTFHGAKFADCGLRDLTDIGNLIIKGVDNGFDINCYDININGNAMSVLHIPPSLDKPHVIRNYIKYDGNSQKPNPHRIFVRKSTATREASKYDIEMMFYDRKNIIPEYKLMASVDFQDVVVGTVPFFTGGDLYEHIKLSLSLTFENAGRRPIAITAMTIDHYKFLKPPFIFSARVPSRPLIIHPNEIINAGADFVSPNYFVKNSEHLSNMMGMLKSCFKSFIANEMYVATNTGKTLRVSVTNTSSAYAEPLNLSGQL